MANTETPEAVNLFRPASKQQARARIAFSGPSGAGKTMWSLQWATVLAKGQPIAVIDTERGSASLYSDRFKFDVLQMRPPYHPDRLVEALKQAEASGYAVVLIDSLTHFWSGQGGVLEIVDDASNRFKGNSHAAWQVGTPIQQRMVDALLGFDGHLIATTRAKTEWMMEQDKNGKVSPRKVGLAPQQRQDIEFEFTVFMDIDATTHKASASKSRFDGFRDRVFDPSQSIEAAEEFAEWLDTGLMFITQTESDSVQQRLDELPKPQRTLLAAKWAELNLPRVKLLTPSHMLDVEQIFQDVTTANTSAKFTEATQPTPDPDPVTAAPYDEPPPQADPAMPVQIASFKAFAQAAKIGTKDQLIFATEHTGRPIKQLSDLSVIEIEEMITILSPKPRHAETLETAYSQDESADPAEALDTVGVPQ